MSMKSMSKAVIGLYLALGLCWVGASGWFGFGCSSQPECRTDRDCVNSKGPEFLCFEQICRDQAVVLKEQPVGPEPGKEPGKEPGPEPQKDASVGPEPGKEPVPELPPIEPDPNAGNLPLGAECQDHTFATKADRCATGLVCVQFDSLTSYCMQDCSTSDQICSANSDGRTVCKQVSWTSDVVPKAIAVCVKIAQSGESCDPQQSIFCQRGRANNHLVCDAGTCKQGTLCDSAGCSCGGQSKVECDLTQKLVCDYATNKCVSGLRAFEGGACGNYKGAQRFCPVDHVCVPYGAGTFPDICLRLCNLNNPANACQHRQPKSMKCIDVGGGRGACIQDSCLAQKECAFQSYPHICQIQGTGQNRQVSCNPLPFEGPNDFAQYCALNDKAKSCKHPFQCTASYCTIQCRVDDDCKAWHPKARCFLRNTVTGINSCGFQCTDGCPSPLKCREGQNFCEGTAP